MERLEALLRVPSVSAVPDHAPDMERAAALVADEIRRAGGEAAVTATPRHPLVLGEVPASAGDGRAPRVVVYGHYDVQPPGPEELWTTPAFEPVIRDGNLYARGASDDKGNLFMLLVAVQRLAAAGELPVRVGFVVEGEEESGGTSALEHFAADAEPALATLIFDSPMVEPGRPSFCTGVRGMLYRRVRVRTAAVDAHSGLYGGAALNAAHALLEILAAVMPRDGRLPAPLYAGVAPAGAAEVAAWDDLPRATRPSPPPGCAPPIRGPPTASTCAPWPRRRSTSMGSPAASRGRSRRSSPPMPRPRCRCGSRADRTPTPWARCSTTSCAPPPLRARR